MASAQLSHPCGPGPEQLHQRQGPEVLGPAHTRHRRVRPTDPAHQDLGRGVLRVPSGRACHHLQDHQTGSCW